jgi:hypothetical protein
VTLSSQQDAIGVGWDVAQDSLTLLTSILPTGDSMKLVGPEVVPHFNPGLIKITGNGFVKTTGYKSVKWVEGILTYLGYAYLSATYCNNGLSGPVTVYTNLGTPTYVRVNAIMILDAPDSYQAENWYKRAPVHITRIRPAS